MIKYSVLIPAYNAETAINETVESIQQQTDRSDCLILLADDGSTDHTANMCDDLAKTYENVIVFHKSNEGSAKTRQFLLEHCTTEYCVFCDADDTWESNAFEIIDLYLQQNDVDILIFCFNLWESKTNKKNIRRYFSSKQKKSTSEKNCRIFGHCCSQQII